MQSPSAPLTKAQVFRSRLLSTCLLWGVVLGAFATGNPWVFSLLISGLGMVAVLEYFKMLRLHQVPSQPRWGLFACLAHLATLGVLGALGETQFMSNWSFMAPWVVGIGTFCVALLRPVEGRRTLTEIGTTLIGFVYLAMLFGASYLLIFLPSGKEVAYPQAPGAWLGLYLIMVTKFTDMGAYLTGSLIGKHKMIPHISPGKTWEGFAGALVFAQVVGFVLYTVKEDQFFGIETAGELAFLNLVIALLSVLGDLAGSLIKRSLGVKDAGHVLPGIGGIFDLIDSICFTAPFLVLYLIFLN